MSAEHLDVLIVGAGLSGIGAACRLTRTCPSKSIAVLEARETSGGTWDLFRYPGVRSDSDMFTLGYPFRPWANSTIDRPRRRDSGLPARDRDRVRGGPADPLPAPGDQR